MILNKVTSGSQSTDATSHIKNGSLRLRSFPHGSIWYDDIYLHRHMYRQTAGRLQTIHLYHFNGYKACERTLRFVILASNVHPHLNTILRRSL